MTAGTATIIDGRALAKAKRVEVAQVVANVRALGRDVRLDAVLVEQGDSAARLYAERQRDTCAELGIEYHLHTLREGAAFEDIAGRVLLLNEDDRVHAVMLHLPLPEGIEPYRVQRLIDADKDVEGVNPANIGNIVYGRSSLAPCTALATLNMILSTGIELRGKRCVVVGAGDVVGKPIAVLLMRHEATVVSCNEWTHGAQELCRSADVLVAAAGVPGLVTREHVKPGAVVVDVGVNRIDDGKGGRKTVGDVAFDEVAEVAGALSTVPGGVGPMTVAMLLANVAKAASGNV